MKKNISTFWGLALLLLLLSGCGGSSESTTVDEAGKHNENLLESTGKPEAAGWFVAEVTSGNLFLKEIGRLASSKAENPQLREFGQLMLDNHTQLNTQLKQIADLKNLIMPTGMGPDHQEKYNAVLEKNGAEFDQAFLEAVAEVQEDVVERYLEFVEEGTDTEFKNYAQQTLPTLQAHKERLTALKEAMP